MEKSLQELISACLIKAREEQSTRENSLVITKLQESLMWHNEHQRALIDTARRSGVGFNPNVRQTQIVEPVVIEQNDKPV